MKARLLSWVLGVLSLILVSVASANLADPCIGDLQRFCQYTEPGGGKLLNCLLNKQEELSPACRTQAIRLRSLLTNLERSCHNDRIKFCGDIEPGQGRLAHCLLNQGDNLSLMCKAEIQNTRDAKRDL